MSIKQVAQRATIAHLRALGSRYYATKFRMDHINSKREKVKSSIFRPYLLPWKPVVRSSQISNSSKLSCMLSLPASMKRIRSDNREKVETSFSHYKPMGIFFRRSRAANSAVGGSIRLKFKLVQALMHDIVTCNYEKEPMKNSGEKVETQFFPS